MRRRSSKYFLKLFTTSWIFVIFLRIFGFMNYDNISGITYATISLFVILFIIGYLMGTKYVLSIKLFRVEKVNVTSEKGLKILVLICIALSLIAIVSMYLKVRGQSELYGMGFTFEGLSDIRKATMTDRGYEVGSSFSGMIASILFGFPVLSLVIAIVYRKNLKVYHFYGLCIVGIGGIAASFLTGGRFMAFTFVLFVLFTLSFLSNHSKTWFTKRNFFLFVGSIILFVLFSKIFLDRLGVRKISNAIYFLPLCQPKHLTTTLLEMIPQLDTLISLVAYFEYYIAHGVNQLDVLLGAPFPKNAPYFGGYEFGTFYLLFSKIGVPVYTKELIVSEIINPGVYFTQIGAIYLDFGYLAGSVITLLSGFISGNLGVIYNKNEQTLLHIYQYSIFFSLIIMAPIVSLVTSGYFPAIIVSCVFLWFYTRFIKVPNIYLMKTPI